GRARWPPVQPPRTRTSARRGAGAPAAAPGSRRGTSRRASRRLQPLARGRVEEVRLVRPRSERDVISPPRHVPRPGPGDELQLLAADLGDTEDVGVRAELLDDLDARRHSA